jgi:YggT family protein
MGILSMWALLALVLRVVEILLLVRVIVSWVPAWGRSVWGQLVRLVTEPILMPLRAIARIPASGTYGFDFSPMLALLIIQLIRMLFRI